MSKTYLKSDHFNGGGSAAVLAIASPSLAFAGEAKKAEVRAPAIKAVQMSEAEMDRIVAGDEVSFTNNGVNFVIETGRNPDGVVVNNGGTFLLGSASK
jgi:hypothetical protein